MPTAMPRQLRRLLTLDGRAPVVVGGAVVALALFALLDALTRHLVLAWTAFVPSLVWSGQVWRLVTWPLVDPDVVQAIFSAFVFYFFGRDLAGWWGARRLTLVVAGLAVATAAVTALVARVLPDWGAAFAGPWPIAEALSIAWAFAFPAREVLLFGAIGTSGRNLGFLTVGLTVLWAVCGHSLARYLPHFVIEGLTAAYMLAAARIGPRPGRSSGGRDGRKFGVIRGGRDNRDEGTDHTWN